MSDAPKRAALEQIAVLAAEHHLSIGEIKTFLNSREPIEHSGTRLGRILGYIGGAFIFGGLVLFTSMQWDILGSFGRVLVTFGAGLVAFILGIITLKDERYKNASTPLFLSAAALQPIGIFVFLDEYTNGNDVNLACLIVFSLMAFQFLAIFFKLQRTSLLFCGYVFYNTALAFAFERVGVDDNWIGVILGGCNLLIGHALNKGPHQAIAPLWIIIGALSYYTGVSVLLSDTGMDGDWIGVVVSLSILTIGCALDRDMRGNIVNLFFIIGSGLFLGSTFDILQGTAFDVFLLVVAVGMMFFSVQMRSRALLMVNTLGLFAFLGYYTSEYFSNVVGWPVALIILGFLMVGISSAAIKLDRRMRSI